MSHDARLPAMIWHLAHAANWAAALGRGSYAISTRGATLEQVGFVHASFGQQVERVAELVYADGAPLTLLGNSTRGLWRTRHRRALRARPPVTPRGGALPHIYGAVQSAGASRRSTRRAWSTAPPRNHVAGCADASRLPRADPTPLRTGSVSGGQGRSTAGGTPNTSTVESRGTS